MNAKKASTKKAPAFDPNWNRGSLVDERFEAGLVQDALKRHLAPVELASFLAFFGEAIGAYRMRKDAESSMPTVTDEIEYLHKLFVDLESIAGRLENLPPLAAGQLLAVSRGDNVQGGINHRLAGECVLVSGLLKETASRLEPYRVGQSGRKADAARDELLAAVIEKLAAGGMSKNAARPCAAAVLKACSIASPEDGRTRSSKQKV